MQQDGPRCLYSTVTNRPAVARHHRRGPVAPPPGPHVRSGRAHGAPGRRSAGRRWRDLLLDEGRLDEWDAHLTPGDPHVIANTKIVGGGQSDTITFSTAKLSKGGDYTFMCTFPGHYVIMKGVFKFG